MYFSGQEILLFWIGLIVFMLFLPMVLTLWDATAKYILRSDVLKTPSVVSFVDDGEPELCWVLLFAMGGFVSSLLVAAFFDLIVGFDTQVNILWFGMLGVPTALRFIVDVGRNLKINNKTGDSRRLAELEKQLDELKSNRG